MKKYLLLGLLFFFSPLMLIAQNFDLYGLWWEETEQIILDTIIASEGDTVFIEGGNTGNQYLVTVDPLTGEKSNIGVVDEVQAVAFGSSTFDQEEDRYVFWGIDVNLEKRIYNLELENSLVVNDAPLSDETPFELQFDLNQSRLFGLTFDYLSELSDTIIEDTGDTVVVGNGTFITELFLSELDVATGALQDIGEIDGIELVLVSSATINSKQGTYHFVGIDEDNEQRLYTISTEDASILHSPLMPASYQLVMAVFDEQSETYLAVGRDPSGTAIYFSLDIETGAPSFIAPLSSIGPNDAFVGGSAVYSQAEQILVFQGYINNQAELILLDGITGALISQTVLQDRVIEMEISNAVFAKEFFADPCEGFDAQIEATCLEDINAAAIILSILSNDEQLVIESNLSATPITVFNENAETGGAVIFTDTISQNIPLIYTVYPINAPECAITFSLTSPTCVVTSIDLLEFQGLSTENGNEITWSSASENNSKYFMLQRSIDGLDFETINVKANQGNSTIRNDYRFLDREINSSEIHYYRLLEEDLDANRSIISEVIFVENRQLLEQTNIYPIPAEDFLFIESKSHKFSAIQILDLAGKHVLELDDINLTGQVISIPVDALSPGQYFLRLQAAGSWENYRFVIH